MVVGLGIDVVEIDRIEAAIKRFGDRFTRRILSEAELAAMQNPSAARVAGLFAAKEAGVKALGTGFRDGISFHDVQIIPDPLGRPVLTLHGQARERGRTLSVDNIHVSITHGRDTAAAVVVLERA